MMMNIRLRHRCRKHSLQAIFTACYLPRDVKVSGQVLRLRAINKAKIPLVTTRYLAHEFWYGKK